MNADTPGRSAGSGRREFGVRLARMTFVWAALVCLNAWRELNWSGGFREIYAHVGAHQDFARLGGACLLVVGSRG